MDEPQTTPSLDSASPSVPEPRSNLLWYILAGLFIIALVALGWFLKGRILQNDTQPAPTETDTGTVLHVATVVDEDGAAADAKEYKDFDTYLASKLHDQGISRVDFTAYTSASEVAKLLRQGKIDLYIDSAFPVYVVNKLAESTVMADRWKGGVETYHTIIFVRKDSPLKKLDDLKGHIIGFDSLSSTVGYFFPKAYLIKKGYTLTEKASTTDEVAPGEIGYALVHDKVYDDVADGTTAAGAESELEVRAHFGDTFDQNYRILLTAPDILRFLVTARKDLDPGLANAIKQILFTMDTTPDGKAALKTFADTAKFTPVSDVADAYGDIINLTDIVDEEIIRGASQ